jgi:hypothetical protein
MTGLFVAAAGVALLTAGGSLLVIRGEGGREERN